MVTGDGDNYIRRHWVEWHQKMTFSLACILFFFVGAPLGAIIRKGGLGMPTVISVIIFIIWYMISTSSMKMAREGSINMVVGMWISTIVIAPFSVFITYKPISTRWCSISKHTKICSVVCWASAPSVTSCARKSSSTNHAWMSYRSLLTNFAANVWLTTSRNSCAAPRIMEKHSSITSRCRG